MLVPKSLVKKYSPLQLKGKYWNHATCTTAREKLRQEEVTSNAPEESMRSSAQKLLSSLAMQDSPAYKRLHF